MTKSNGRTANFQVPLSVPWELIYDAVITGMECGPYATFAVSAEGRKWSQGWEAAEKGSTQAFKGVLLELRRDYAEGGDELGDKPSDLSDEILASRVGTFWQRYPERARRLFVEGDGDAIDADAWLQFTLLGSIVYG